MCTSVVRSTHSFLRSSCAFTLALRCCTTDLKVLVTRTREDLSSPTTAVVCSATWVLKSTEAGWILKKVWEEGRRCTKEIQQRANEQVNEGQEAKTKKNVPRAYTCRVGISPHSLQPILHPSVAVRSGSGYNFESQMHLIHFALPKFVPLLVNVQLCRLEFAV